MGSEVHLLTACSFDLSYHQERVRLLTFEVLLLQMLDFTAVDTTSETDDVPDIIPLEEDK